MRFRSIRSRLMAAGLGLVALPLAVVNAVWIYKSFAAEQRALDGSVALVNSDLESVANLISQTADSYNKQLEQEVAVMLKVAQSIGKRLGAPRSDGPAMLWTAKNQFTQAEIALQLPAFRYGQIRLNRDADPKIRAPLVDDVRDLTGASCTVFQKMNEAGDMLRVSTSVIAKNGRRATGTYIPSINPDGKPNPVLAKVLKGGTFTGRAFVVDSWYMSAYTPLISLKGDLIGMLYVGVPERLAVEDLHAMLRKLRFGNSGSMIVLNAKGKTRGKAVWPEDGERAQALAAVPSENGNLLDKICARAVTLRTGESALFHYSSDGGPSGTPRNYRIRIGYYPAWDWVIAIDAPDDELFAVAAGIAQEFKSTRNMVLGIAFAGLAIACAAWLIISGRVSEQLSGTALEIRRAAREVSASSEDLAIQSRILDDSAGVQSTAIERSDELGTVISGKSSSMSEAAGNAAKLMHAVRDGAARSDNELKLMIESMGAITGASKRVSSIIKMIDEIALQTRMLALNAAVEAARAGESGRSFSVVAEQVGLTAQRCSEAAAETNRLIKECLDASSAGEFRLEGLAARLVSMTTDLSSATGIVAQVASMSRDQSGELAETAQTLRTIKEAAARMNETARRNAGATTLLRTQGSALDRVIADLECLCGASAA